MWQRIKPYVISVAIALGVGLLASLLTMGSMDILNEVKTPPLTPPSLIFPIVWTILYTLMGISAAIVYSKGDESETSTALTFYAMQLIVNFAWSLIFFNYRAFLFAFIWLLLLLVLIIKMIAEFRKISPLAAYLQIPYALWVSFAGYLTFGIWLLNK